jgi:hypothetical protein
LASAFAFPRRAAPAVIFGLTVMVLETPLPSGPLIVEGCFWRSCPEIHGRKTLCCFTKTPPAPLYVEVKFEENLQMLVRILPATIISGFYAFFTRCPQHVM